VSCVTVSFAKTTGMVAPFAPEHRRQRELIRRALHRRHDARVGTVPITICRWGRMYLCRCCLVAYSSAWKTARGAVPVPCNASRSLV
jgi:hypothetical protein